MLRRKETPISRRAGGKIKNKEVKGMAVFKCTECGHEKEARCKPQKCPKCEGRKTFEKKEAK